MNYKILETKERVLADNDAAAEATRAKMRENGTLLVNLMGSPGAGKTSVLLRIIEALKGDYAVGVMEADVDSDVDAKTVSEAGAKVIQLHSGGLCHMDADMTARGLDALETDGLDVIFLENIGNLVCPAEFEIGADLRIMILSVPEGDDKPLKYPLMFAESDALAITKTDALPYFDFDMDKCIERVKKLNPTIEIFPVSAKTGEGMAALEGWLKAALAQWRRETISN